MSRTTERRLSSAENKLGCGRQTIHDVLLGILAQGGFEALVELVDRVGGKAIGGHVEVETCLILETRDPFELERYRGLVPEAVLARAYGAFRNHGFRPDVLTEVRLRAGVIDGHGNLLPGYLLTANDSIIDAPPGGEE